MSTSQTPTPSAADKINLQFLETQVLPTVNKPGRYLGLEQGAYRKPFSQAAVRMVAAFPDLYEIGFSNYGLKLLYSLVNQQENYLCDRVYAPAPDFKAKLAEHQIPLYGVESMEPLANFDLIAFSLQYELNYTTIFGLLEAAQIPFRSADRTDATFPLIIAGGPGSANPMPLAPFFDAFIIGDGEEVLLEILAVIETAKKTGQTKPALLQELAKLEGLFIPGLTEKAHKRIVDIAENPVELAPLIPTVGAVHDRVVVEARRGCDRMCRFCQPCFVNLPVREQSIENIRDTALKEIEKTGYEECSLLSLSIADYSYFKPLILEVADALKEKNVSLSLPSQRADRFSVDVADAVQSIRKSTLTFAPEAGTDRLRDVINKNLSDAEISRAVTSAYRSGWNKVKLYFMIGLPTETDADLDGIVDTVKRLKAACADIQRDPSVSNKKHLEVNLTLSNFVPKPHTPFQWFPQDTVATLKAKIGYLKDKFRQVRGVKLNFTDPEISKLEAVIAKGDEKLADVIELAYKKGAYLDAWDDMLSFEKWFSAFEETGIDVEAETHVRFTNPEEPLPWDVIDMGLDKKWLQEEYQRATEAAGTVPCFEACSTCGVCATYNTWPKFNETPPKELVQGSNGASATSVGASSGQAGAITGTLSRPPVIKARLKIEKRGKLRFISHLDWLRLIHRTILRSGLPVAYSQGFNPAPKVAFGPALPLFTEGNGEYIDIELTEPVPDIARRMNPHLPPNGKVLGEALLPLSVPGIDKSIRALNYSARWTCNDPMTEYTIVNRVNFLAAEKSLPIEVETKKSRKSFDLTEYLSDLRLTTSQKEGSLVTFQLSRPQGGQTEKTDGSQQYPVTLKPEWVLNLIDPDQHWSIVRTEIVLGEATSGAGSTEELPTSKEKASLA